MTLDVATVISIDAELQSLLVTSLKSNNKLKEFYLRLQILDEEENPPSLTPFNSLIDTSSFESVCGSNSTLEKLDVTVCAWITQNELTEEVAIELPEDATNF
jgi:hypothetical protein